MAHGFMVSLLLKGSSYGAVFFGGGINPSPEIEDSTKSKGDPTSSGDFNPRYQT